MCKNSFERLKVLHLLLIVGSVAAFTLFYVEAYLSYSKTGQFWSELRGIIHMSR